MASVSGKVRWLEFINDTPCFVFPGYLCRTVADVLTLAIIPAIAVSVGVATPVYSHFSPSASWPLDLGLARIAGWKSGATISSLCTTAS